MTFSVGHVQGGTGAGRKRPLADKPEPWRCSCPNPHGYASRYMEQPGYLKRCPDCKVSRP